MPHIPGFIKNPMAKNFKEAVHNLLAEEDILPHLKALLDKVVEKMDIPLVEGKDEAEIEKHLEEFVLEMAKRALPTLEVAADGLIDTIVEQL